MCFARLRFSRTQIVEENHVDENKLLLYVLVMNYHYYYRSAVVIKQSVPKGQSIGEEHLSPAGQPVVDRNRSVYVIRYFVSRIRLWLISRTHARARARSFIILSFLLLLLFSTDGHVSPRPSCFFISTRARLELPRERERETSSFRDVVLHVRTYNLVVSVTYSHRASRARDAKRFIAA